MIRSVFILLPFVICLKEEETSNKELAKQLHVSYAESDVVLTSTTICYFLQVFFPKSTKSSRK